MLETIERASTEERIKTGYAGLISTGNYLDESNMVTPKIRSAFDDLDSALDDLASAWHGESNMQLALDSLDKAEAKLLGIRAVSSALCLMNMGEEYENT